MKVRIVFVMMATAVVINGCGPSAQKTVKAKQPATKVTTRWKWTPKSEFAITQGLIIEQAGDQVQASFVALLDGDGFVVERKISQGKYFPDKRQIILPPGPLLPEQWNQWLRMDGQRIEVAFTPEAKELKGRWVGKGGSDLEIDFVRVQD